MQELLGYCRAVICEDGHIISSNRKAIGEIGREFCELCGKRALGNCDSCSKIIRGIPTYRVGRAQTLVEGPALVTAPAYCFACGTPYPWTVRQLSTAREIAREELNEQELSRFEENLRDLLNDNPRNEIAAHRMAKIFSGAKTKGKELLWKLVVDVASEGAKKLLLGG